MIFLLLSLKRNKVAEVEEAGTTLYYLKCTIIF